MKEQFKSIQILHYALLGGCLMIGFLLMALGPDQTDMGNDLMMPMVIGLMTLSCIYFSSFIYNSRLKEVKNLGDLDEKLDHYRTNSIIRWALLEGPALCCIVMMFLFGNYLFLIFYGFAVVALFLARPSVEGFIKDFKLTSQEAGELRSAMR